MSGKVCFYRDIYVLVWFGIIEQLGGPFQASSIAVLSGWTSWLSDFDLDTSNAQFIFSSAAYTAPITPITDTGLFYYCL